MHGMDMHDVHVIYKSVVLQVYIFKKLIKYSTEICYTYFNNFLVNLKLYTISRFVIMHKYGKRLRKLQKLSRDKKLLISIFFFNIKHMYIIILTTS